MRWRAWMVSAMALGCGPSVANGDGDGSGGDTSTSSPTSVSTTTTSTTTSTTSSSTATSVDTSTSGSSSTTLTGDSADSSDFIHDPDGGCVDLQCDVWSQDCPRGEKCVPWSGAGDGTFAGCVNARCSDLDPDPQQPGEPCLAPDGPWGGADNCDVSSYCWNVDPMTNVGVCVGLCMGSEANPVCEDDALSCFQLAGSSVTACVPSCDPLAPLCPPAMTCTMSLGNDYAPLCVSQSLNLPTGAGTECDVFHGCGDGFVCVPQANDPSCATEACCAAPCDLANPACPPEQPACTDVATTPDGLGACLPAM